MEKLLRDYDIKPTKGALDWLESVFTGLITAYEKDYGVTLSASQRIILGNFAMRMVYDLLHVQQ